MRDAVQMKEGIYWIGGAVSAMREFAALQGNELLEPVVEAKHSPCDADIDACRQLGKEMAERL